jgi:cation transport ATPase
MDKKRVKKILSIVCLILLIPLLGMAFSDGWDWGVFDFVFMGALLFITGLSMNYAWRKFNNPSQKIMVVTFVGIVFLAIYTELAVGAVSQIIYFLIG